MKGFALPHRAAGTNFNSPSQHSQSGGQGTLEDIDRITFLFHKFQWTRSQQVLFFSVRSGYRKAYFDKQGIANKQVEQRANLRSELVVVGLKGEIKDCPATTSLIPGKEGRPRVTNSSFLKIYIPARFHRAFPPFGVQPSGKASVFGTGMQRFESFYSRAYLFQKIEKEKESLIPNK